MPDNFGEIYSIFCWHFLRWHVLHFVTYLWTSPLMFEQYNFYGLFPLFYPVPDEVDTCDTISLQIFGVAVE